MIGVKMKNSNQKNLGVNFKKFAQKAKLDVSTLVILTDSRNNTE